jgi:glutamate dehydrogenase/leucine dehydrogenase
VQGFGNVGSFSAQFLSQAGMKIVGVSDTSGALFNPEGIDIERLFAHVRKNRVIEGFSGGRFVKGLEAGNAELFSTPCDVLVPAAMGGQITACNAAGIKAKVVIEAANGPTTPEADIILEKKGITVVPDVLTNSGGVVVSYFEWVQDLQSYFWDEKEIADRLEKIMIRAFNSVWGLHEKQKVSVRTAAYLLAIGRVAEAMRERGTG